MPSQKTNDQTADSKNDDENKDQIDQTDDKGTKKTTKSKRKSSVSSRLKTPKSAQHPPYLKMIFDSIAQLSSFGRSVSRPAIVNYIKKNYEGLGEGGLFNANIRKALQKGLDDGLLVQGDTLQQFKLSPKGRKELKQEEESSPTKKKK